MQGKYKRGQQGQLKAIFCLYGKNLFRNKKYEQGITGMQQNIFQVHETWLKPP